ncbi:MAG: radical SAM protein [Deltaproteobacteria bacterium]|nr:radical SAM protein [Deltaproteobacteria bacterium]
MSDLVYPARPRKAGPLRATCPEDAQRVLLTTRRVEGETRNPLAILDLAPYIRRYSGRHVEAYYWEDLPDRSYDVVGLSILQHTASDDPIDDLVFLKQKYGGARIVVGGKWVDTLTEDERHSIREQGIDVCHGQGEPYFVPDRPIVDFDRYPAWDLRDLQTFMGWDSETQKLIYRARPEVMSTRGRPFNCHFCHNTERKVKFFSSQRTVDNIELLLGQGCPEIWFQDDIFTLRPDRMVEIHELMEERGHSIKGRCKFFCHINYINDDTIKAMKLFDPLEIQIGVESGDTEMIHRLGKRFTAEKAFDNISDLLDEGLRVYPLFLMGYPGETVETMEKTLRFIERLKPRLHKGVWVSYYQPCKGTTGYDQAMARNPAFGVARNEDITYVDPNLTRGLMQDYRARMMARPTGVTDPEWRTAAGPSPGTLGA